MTVKTKRDCVCRQEVAIKRLEIDSAVSKKELENMSAKIDQTNKTVNNIDKKLGDFIESANKEYATKKEVAEIKDQVQKNSNSIYKLTIEVAKWGVLIVAVAKLAGLW